MYIKYIQTEGLQISFGIRSKIYEYIENIYAVWIIICVEYYPKI